MSRVLRHVRTRRLEIAYEQRGPSDGARVMLLHGWPDDVRTWDGVVDRLTADGWQTVTPYLRGCGPSRFLDATTIRSGQLTALGVDLLELAQALGWSRFAVVGHDWGARAAYIASTEAPERISHCVALSVGYGTNDPDQAVSLKQARNYWYHWYFCLPRGEELVANDRRALCQYLWRTWSPTWVVPEGVFETTARSFDNPDWAAVTIHSYRHRWGRADGDPEYAAIEHRLSALPVSRVPTLVLHGDADACNDPSTSEGKDRFFAGRYHRVVLPGLGHFPQREQPDIVAREIGAWLRR